MDRLGIDWIGGWYIQHLKEGLVLPEGFNPRRKRHKESQDFLLRERLHNFFFPDAAQRNADHILRTPRVREFVEAMIISDAPPGMIAVAAENRFRTPITTEGVQRFKSCYWNVELLSSTELRALLDLRGERASLSDDPDIAIQAKLLTRAGWKDPRRVAAQLPSSPISALLSQMRLGVMPNGLNLQEILQKVQEGAALRAFEAIQHGDTLDDASKANFYISTARSAGEMLSGMATPEESLLRHLKKLTIKTDAESPPTVQQLSGGSHTADVQIISSSEKAVK